MFTALFFLFDFGFSESGAGAGAADEWLIRARRRFRR